MCLYKETKIEYTINMFDLFTLGGHTTEILRLMGSLSDAYSPRIYILADTDKLSEEKIKHFESGRKTEGRNSQVSWKQFKSKMFTNYDIERLNFRINDK